MKELYIYIEIPHLEIAQMFHATRVWIWDFHKELVILCVSFWLASQLLIETETTYRRSSIQTNRDVDKKGARSLIRLHKTRCMVI